MAELRGKYHQIYKVGPNSLNVYLHIVNNDIDLVVVVTLLHICKVYLSEKVVFSSPVFVKYRDLQDLCYILHITETLIIRKR